MTSHVELNTKQNKKQTEPIGTKYRLVAARGGVWGKGEKWVKVVRENRLPVTTQVRQGGKMYSM